MLALVTIGAQSALADGLVQVELDASGKATPSECRDKNDSCRLWASEGECSSNPGFMHGACRESCFQCESLACRNDDSSCEAWAMAGECAANEAFMVSACAHACRICFVNQTATCRRGDDAVAAASPGSLDANFERLVSDPGPSESPRPKGRVLSREPWVLEFDDFLSASEADELVRPWDAP